MSDRAPSNPLRLTAVRFLNARPLFVPLLDEPVLDQAGTPLFTITEALPSECAERLAAGACDLALVPVAALLDHPEWEVVPQIAIACRGAVQTVLVVGEVPLESMRRIHVDAASRSSVLLLRILLADLDLHPELVTVEHGRGPSAIGPHEGALVIGDAAFGLARRFASVADLGAMWMQRTGLPMVFACWAARPGLLQPAHVKALQAARRRGVDRAEAIARGFREQRLAAGETVEDENTYANYLRRTIRYELDAWEREGLVELLARARTIEPGRADDDVHVRFALEAAPAKVARPRTRPLDVGALLGAAAEGRRLDFHEGVFVLEHADVLALGEAAAVRRTALHPEPIVTYIIDRNVNYTNVCTARCKFCNFYVPPGGRTHDQRGYVLDREELARKFHETEALGGVQILLQGGLNPELDLAWYEDLFRWTKANFRLRLHALSPTEIIHIAQKEDLPVRTVLERLRAAGMDSLPGGGAEILDDEVRNRISPFKNTADEWLDVMEQAHAIGMRTTCTMVFGFQERPEQIVGHLDRLRSLQDRTGGFTAFIAWPFQAEGTRLKLRDDTSAWRYLRIQAFARLYLDNVPNIQVSWPTLGPEIGEIGLHFGANDFGSVMIEENVVSTAGAHYMLDAELLERHVRQAGFRPARRNMAYEILELR